MRMDDALKQRFFQRMLKDLLTDKTKPFPTILCEMDDPGIIELVRKNCMFADPMKPFRIKPNLLIVTERLEIQRAITGHGMLYILVDVN